MAMVAPKPISRERIEAGMSEVLIVKNRESDRSTELNQKVHIQRYVECCSTSAH